MELTRGFRAGAQAVTIPTLTSTWDHRRTYVVRSRERVRTSVRRWVGGRYKKSLRL